jgi:hypothetical protein
VVVEVNKQPPCQTKKYLQPIDMTIFKKKILAANRHKSAKYRHNRASGKYCQGLGFLLYVCRVRVPTQTGCIHAEDHDFVTNK